MTDHDEPVFANQNNRHLRLVTTSSEPVSYQPTRGLQEIHGLKTVKRNLIDIIETVRNRASAQHEGWLGGTLLYGPVGCGKVFSVEVVAGELGVPLHIIDLAAGWDRASFNTALERTREMRADTELLVVHLENIDHPAAAELLTPALPLLDNASNNGRLVVMASATLPWQVSNSLARHGRLGRVLLVLPPDEPTRETFLHDRFEGHATISANDLGWLSMHTDGHSFADLEHLIEVAVADRDNPTLTHEEVRHARQAVPPSTAEWLSVAGHHAIMNQAGGMYDDLLFYFHVRTNS